MATTVNKSPSGVQTRLTRRSRPPPMNDIPQVTTRKSAMRCQVDELSNESMTSNISKGPGNSRYSLLHPGVEHAENMYKLHAGSRASKTSDEPMMSCKDHSLASGNLADNEGDMLMNGEDEGLKMDNGGEEASKSKSGKQLRTMVNRLAPTPGFVDKNSLPSDLMTRSRVRRVASLNAAAKVSMFLEQSSPLAGRSITDIMTHSKKGQSWEDEFLDEEYIVRPKNRPREASNSTDDLLPSPELLSQATRALIGNPQYEINSENSARLKRLRESDGEFYEAKRAKLNSNGGDFLRRTYEQNGDYNTIITERRFLKGKEVVDVGLQVKIPKLKSVNNQLNPSSSVQCTCRSATVMDIPVKSYVSTYANGSLVSIPITKTHRLTPQVPEKPLPELAQGDLANRSKRVAGLNSRAMLNAILCEERQLPQVEQNVGKPVRKLQQKKSYYEHGLSNTIPSKLKIPKINFAATSTSNFGGRKLVGSQKTPGALWSKSGQASHDGPKRTNGWFYLGSPIVKPYYYNDTKVMRKYYIGIKRNDEVIYVRDSVLLKSGPRRKDLPFVARVSGFWEEEEGLHAGEMMMSVLWYYRPEQTEMGKQPNIHGENEILASRHKDDNSVACIVDKCYVLSYPEYCRHKAAIKRAQDSRTSSSTLVPPAESTRSCRERIPSTCDPKLVFFCRQIYDYRMGRILKNPLYV